MQIIIDIPNVPIKDYKDLYYKIYNMAASEGLFDDKVKSQHALALKAVLDVLEGVVNGTPPPKGHGDLIDVNRKITVTVYDEQYEEWGEETLTVREVLNRWSDEGITVKDVVILADKEQEE